MADVALQTESLRHGKTRRSLIAVENEVVRQYERLEVVRISAHAPANRPGRRNGFLSEVRGPRSEA
jgi:hypothetical protein